MVVVVVAVVRRGGRRGWQRRGQEGHGGGVAVGGAGGEVGQEAQAQGLAGLQALHGAQEAGGLGHTLPEAQGQEVQGQGVAVEIT